MNTDWMKDTGQVHLIRMEFRSDVHACSVAKLCLTFTIPWTVARQAPLSMGFPRQEHWSVLFSPSPGDAPDQGPNYVSRFGRRIFFFFLFY